MSGRVGKIKDKERRNGTKLNDNPRIPISVGHGLLIELPYTYDVKDAGEIDMEDGIRSYWLNVNEDPTQRQARRSRVESKDRLQRGIHEHDGVVS